MSSELKLATTVSNQVEPHQLTVLGALVVHPPRTESISALFKTNFSTDYPFDPLELLVFSFIGATCGLAGAAYIKFHRMIVQFFRRHKRISAFFQKK